MSKRTILVFAALALTLLVLGGCDGLFGGTARKLAEITPPKILTVREIVHDTSALFRFLTIISMIGAAVSVGSIFVFQSIAPPLKFIGYAGLVTFGSLFGLSLGTNLVLPYLPWIFLTIVVIISIAGLYYAYKHINWTTDEKEGLDDLSLGLTTEKSAKLITKVLNSKKVVST